MDKMPSTQFRSAYASLTQPVEVTVNGHAIGTWLPSPYSAAEFRTITTPREAMPAEVPGHGFSTRPFTPVPKKR